ncbi:A33 protein, partial [Grantiella picta]|nr:A33 protein [Grantiella picta]
VTLDADTAHPRLEITGRGVVKDTAVIRDVPSNEKRFDTELIVLAKEGYRTGKRFWDVDVGRRTSWALGVALESVTRKGPLTLSPENGFWVIGSADGVDYWAYTYPWTRLKVSEELQMIGILLDIPGKRVTFYDTIRGKSLYTFSIAVSRNQKRKFIPLFSTGPAAAEPDAYGLEVM